MAESWRIILRPEKSEYKPQDPEDKQPHTYGAIKQQSGKTVTAIFAANQPEGGQPDHPGTNQDQQILHASPLTPDPHITFFAQPD